MPKQRYRNRCFEIRISSMHIFEITHDNIYELCLQMPEKYNYLFNIKFVQQSKHGAHNAKILYCPLLPKLFRNDNIYNFCLPIVEALNCLLQTSYIYLTKSLNI